MRFMSLILAAGASKAGFSSISLTRSSLEGASGVLGLFSSSSAVKRAFHVIDIISEEMRDSQLRVA